ncbi:hypothetical protein TVNIR_3741 [Thioalkalivibrio nitratireducens DSM 14787]|uniref:Uncharacterized protein n=1 Tax=Thioalkalivibrio nitratireducens (strain DSM 14787 / UNIQEM 213 / ALEN2) TaxID=1255043 RepID=L0E0N3_THIND|nr:hypothetical protein [Thioalkalivibrio nitratireducens]AGA35369.1 hypothetical protein TVNIR_3741 [Thioalkalivibrio nitratireducens DSM 14787]
MTFSEMVSRSVPWAAALLGVAALWVWADRLLPGRGADTAVIVEPRDCDLAARTCLTPLPSGGTLRVAIEPRPIRHLEPMNVEVAFSELDPEWVEIDLSGVEMFMGYQRPRLERIAPGHYRGEAVLPACTGERMTWAVTVLPEGDPDRAEARFHFVTRNTGAGGGT